MPINYIAVLIASIVSMIIGALWYSPFLFGDLWLRYSKIIIESKAGVKVNYFLNFIATLVMAYVLDYLIFILGYNDVLSGVFIGFLAWVFIAAVLFITILWEGKSFYLYFINAGYHLVSLMLIFYFQL